MNDQNRFLNVMVLNLRAIKTYLFINRTVVSMPWMKASTAGFFAALLMFALMYVGINIMGVAPFQIPPSAAVYVQVLGLSVATAKIFGLITHFLYGIFWSIVLLAIFWDRTSVGKGVGMSLGLWLLMMLVHSPIIGWGFFGFGAETTGKLTLGSESKYILVTLVLHLLYGVVIGWINSNWVVFGQDVAAQIRGAAQEDRLDFDEETELT